MNTNPSSHSILSIGNNEIREAVLGNWRESEHYSSFRSIKKQFRHNKPALIVACIREDEDENLSKQVTQYVREGLANQDTRIVLLHESSFELDEIRWMEELQINGCLLAEESKQSFNLTTLNREIDTFLYIDNNRRQHDAETEMLMCITRFSRDNESLTELLKVFSSTLSKLCCSSCSFHIHMKNIDQATIDYCDNDKEGMVEKLNQLLGLPKIPGYLQHSLDERQPQINLLPDDINLDAIQSQINENIGSYLTFPIIVYEKVLYLLVYFIPENQMNNVSMKQINVINKASEQLTMLLERRQAESSLKKQYKRLQNTLIELKSAKEELQHKEKMASIGQMAAGIAHEINNPLSYVISNFSSMDNYLNSIIQLQDLQSKFLESIESGQDQKINELKKNISRFEEEEDISFILEDIRAVISDSHSGLKRVKNIITDLKSFTYSQSTELEICNLGKVIDDTLKLLSYDLEGKVSIQKNYQSIPDFMAHNGLMQQVLTNLIKNADQALKEANTSNPTITISASNDDQKIIISIHDNGPGIPEEEKEKIFEPFFTTKTVGEGTGLGLSVTFNIVKKLGGNIIVKSEKNNFTEFTITFPLKAE